MSFNSITILGNVGRDPEIKNFPSGGKFANFSIATSESWRDKSSGERKEKTQWHNVVVKNEGIIGVVEKFVSKGSKVLVQGKLEYREWTDKDGNKRISAEIVVGPFGGTLSLEGGKDDGGDRGGSSERRESKKEETKGGSTPRLADQLDDDIPFAPEWR